MSTSDQRFQTFVTRVRPHRVAVLTNVDDPNWQDSCLGIIEFLTKLWGGSHCVIIPTDGKTISDEFWAVLSSYDPDVFLKYQTTYSDLRRRAPAEFERILEEEVAKGAANFGSTPDEIRDQIEESIAKSPLEAFTISDDLTNQILIRLAPFHFEKHLNINSNRQLRIGDIRRGSAPSYPLTKVIDVLGAVEVPKQVIQITRDVSEGTAPPELWLAAEMGSADPEYLAQLSAKNVVLLPAPMSKFRESQLIHWGIAPWQVLKSPSPFALSKVALVSGRSSAARQFELPTIVVVGDSIREFCLYHALLWQQGRALWLPQWFIPSGGQGVSRLTTAVLSAIDNGRLEQNEGLILVTFTVAAAAMEEIREVVGKHCWGCSISLGAITTGLVREQLQHPSRVFAKGNIGDITTRMLVEDRLPGWFESPVPSALNPVSPQSHRWLVDIIFMEHLIPRHPALGKVAISGPNVGDARSGIEGVSYMCPGAMVMGDDMATNTLRPSVLVPNAESIFRITLEDCGYQCKISDKGRYEVESVQKFGALEGIAFALWADRHRGLLKKFLDPSESQKGVHDEGVLLKDGRRYLNFAAISKLLGGEDPARKTIDDYVAKGIFYRGFIFGCDRCSDVGWFSVAEIDQTFVCRRCGTNQQYTYKSWRAPDEPSWFYKLDEMIYLMLFFNGDVPLLTLNNLRLQSNDSFLYCPELRITPKGGAKMYLEIDVCCIANGLLCIGEAKSVDTLKTKDLTALQTAERYRDLALQLGATMVVFSTSQPEWSIGSRDAIRTAFENHPHICVRELTASDLY